MKFFYPSLEEIFLEEIFLQTHAHEIDPADVHSSNSVIGKFYIPTSSYCQLYGSDQKIKRPEMAHFKNMTFHELRQGLKRFVFN